MSKNYRFDLPEQFARNIVGLYGVKGEKWLADLPEILLQASGKWRLSKDVRPFRNLTFNFVAVCDDEPTGAEVVLKIGVPEENSSIRREKNALEAFDGKGAVKVLAFDENLCAMLLEKVAPGETLAEVFPADEIKAVRAAVETIKKLPRRPANKSEFPPLENWTEDLAKAQKTTFEPQKVSEARRIFKDLREPPENRLLLHGDVHFDNILSARREPFLLIDPKGCVGEIGYEIAVFLNDLAGWTNHLPNQKAVLRQAVEIFSESFNLEISELNRWAFAQAILAAWWMFEDFGRDWENYVACAKMWKLN